MTLQEAIAADDVNELYSSIEQHENLLDHGSEGPFPNTPLHDAAKQGKTKVAMEIAILKPSLTRMLNRGGDSPMHLALKNKHYHTARALMTLNPELIRVRGRGGITPLHFVAGEKGNNDQENVELLELLAEFLYACKSSIEDLTIQCETAVHIAIKSRNTEAFKVLFGWLKRAYLIEILNWKNEDGNTVLHIAAHMWQPEVIKLLIGHIKVNATNFQRKTALEIFPANLPGDQHLAKRLHDQGLRERRFLPIIGRLYPLLPTWSLSKYLREEPSIYERFTFWVGHVDESARDVILIVAALVATATYQAALTPPGGYWRDNSSNPSANSTVVTANSQAGNTLVTAFNSLVFFISMVTICITAIPLFPRTVPVYLLIVSVGISYFGSLSIESQKSSRFIAAVCGVLLGVGMGIPMRSWLIYSRLRHLIDATGRCVGNFMELKDRK